MIFVSIKHLEKKLSSAYKGVNILNFSPKRGIYIGLAIIFI